MMCSGSLLPFLKYSYYPDLPPPGKERIVIASTGCTQDAFFLTEDDEDEGESGLLFSFSRFFWEQVLNGVNVGDAFTHADRGLFFLQVKHPQSFACMGQTPFLDDTGNGVGNESADGQNRAMIPCTERHAPGRSPWRGRPTPVFEREETA